ncbi:hypothetical protein [Enorma phocaeensis]|uniref:Uncharacterized protein n=1 Tax=Enorma phocaeensis TaxID=1871019 RepID=A0A921ITA3_9ACTN|nr:hypothetical protein [Enorma phocaeensis]HJG37118.1 hypothetical protein [Enorma phocaeensis]
MELRISSKRFTMHKEMDVFDAGGTLRYHAWSELMQLPVNETVIEDATGTEIARICPKQFSLLRSINTVTMADGTTFSLSRDPLGFNVRFEVPELGWELTGKGILACEFEIKDATGIVARIRKQSCAIMADYDVDIPHETDVERVVAIAVVLKQFLIRGQGAATAPAAPA